MTRHLTRAGGRGVSPDAAAGGVPPEADGGVVPPAVNVAGMATEVEVAGGADGWRGDGLPAASTADERAARVAAFLRREAARVLDVDPARLADGRSLIALGLDSLAAAELAAAIEAGLGVPVSFASLLEGASLAELAELVAERLGGEEAAARAALGAVAATEDAPLASPPGGREPATPLEEADVAVRRPRRPLSHGQRALWLLDRMVAGGNPACVLAGAARVRGELDAARLRRALQALAARHPALRTTFETDGEDGVRVVHAEGSLGWSEEDAAGWSASRLAARLVEAAERPFDLAAGPLLRVALFRRAAVGGDGEDAGGQRQEGVGELCGDGAGIGEHRGAGAGEDLVVLAVHHIVADFWSLGLLIGELGALYRGEKLPPLAGSYEDLVERQARLLAGPEGARLAAFWREALPPGAPGLELPADRPRPPLPSFRGGVRRLRLGRDVTAGVQALGRRSGATPFMTLLSAYLVLLHRHSGQDRLLVGTPAAGRSSAGSSGQAGLSRQGGPGGLAELAGLAEVVGYCVNPVVVKGDLSGEPDFAALLGRVREEALAAFAHQDYPFALLAERPDEARDASRSPIFQAMFALYRERHERERGLGGFALGEAGAAIALGGARGPVLASVRLDRRSAQFDLSLLAAELDGELAVALQFNGDLFDGVTAERMLGQLGTLAAAVAGREPGSDLQRRRPSVRELPLLGAGERHQLLLEWGDTAVAQRLPPTARLVHELFEWQAARRPQAPAVAGQGLTLTYGELEARANRLARYLRRLGVGPEVRVGLCVERTPEMVVALLAILEAGGAYVPLDPGHPAERLRLVLADSAPAVLVTEERWLERLGGEGGAGGAFAVCLDREREWIAAEVGAPLDDAAAAGGPESLAYVIYTSGSTGRPKGVGLPHRAVVNFLRAMAERPGLDAGDVVPALTTLTFDIAGLEIYLPLAVGGRVEVVGSEEGADGGRLAARLAASGVTAMQATPATWRLLLDAGWQPRHPDAGREERWERPGRPGRRLAAPRFKALCGGEALPRELAAALVALGVELWNVYGPTETAVWSAVRRVAEPAAAGWRRAAASGVVGLGRPIANTRFYVVDRGLLPVPVGAAGELAIGGEGLARGYWGRPELTAERFVPNPWAASEPAHDGMPAPGQRLYRTGDLVRHRPDGDLEFLGRIDHQVKVRGFRIELGEIESALRQHPAVGQAVVTALGEGTDRRLVAYLVPRTGGPEPESGPAAAAAAGAAGMDDAWAAGLRQWLRRRLPEYMLPADFVALEWLPLSSAGKVDRKALPAPAARWAGEAGGGGRIAPRTPAEELLAGMWSELLGIGSEQVGAADDFFRLGGHSLLAVRVAARLRELLGVELSLPRLLQLSRLEDLAREVEELGRGGRPQPAPIRRLAREAGKALAAAPSFAQERLWFLEQLEPGSPAYNEPRALRLRGCLDVAALAGSLAAIRRRHEVLRTRFAASGSGVVAVADVEVASEQGLPVVDLGRLPGARRTALAERLVAAEARRPFDLGSGPLLRTALLRLAPAGRRRGPRVRRRRHSPGETGEHVLLLTTHHVVSDGWSLEVLARELAAGYAARAARDPGAVGAAAPPPLPALPIQYADFARWQREWLSGETLAAELAFWREQLAGARGMPPHLELPQDRPRPAVASSRGARRTQALPPALAGELAALGQRHGATLFMTLLAAFGALLVRYSGQSDVAVGTVIANRGRLETENLIGLFVNTLVLRVDLGGDPAVGELLGRVRQTAMGAYAHQDVPFDKLVGELGAPRGLAESPFFQTVLAIHAAPPPLALPGVAVEVLEPFSGTAKFDLSLAVAKTAAGGLTCSWTWRTDLFDAATVERLGSHWRNLLAGMAKAGTGGPGAAARLAALPLLAAAERHQLLVEWSDSGAAAGTAREAGDDLVHTPFERRAVREPDAVALVAGQAAGPGGRGLLTLTYRELAARANRLARTLRGLGVGPEQVVGICAEPSCALVAGLLGILEAGGAYLPLDPAHPPERLAELLADAGARVVLAEERTAERLRGMQGKMRLVLLDGDAAGSAPDPGAEPFGNAAPGNAAYILYTSGSTGTPKGVVVPHRAVVNRLRYQVAADLAPGARVLQRTRLGFDVSVVEIFAPLWIGATVVLPEAGRQQDAPYLARLIVEQQVTNVNVPPVFFPALLAEETFRGCRSLRRVVTGGDRVPGDLPGRYFSTMAGAAPALFARYGPTETTVSVADWRCRDEPYGPSVPIGRPIAGARIHLLDRSHREVPPGVGGELCIGGAGVARGYLGRPELTAAAFIPDPFARWPEAAGERLYRTGDLARWRPGGVIEFLGRIDRQVKIRGIRLELGEVEAALARHPEVRETAVIDCEEPVTRGKRLVAYVVPRAAAADAPPSPASAPPLDARRLRAFLTERLPAAMVPAAFVLLPRLPLLPNLKLDRAALPPPESVEDAGDAGADEPRAPRGPVEEVLAGLWARLLGRERVGVDQDFFELGGHSLLATQLVSRVRETFAVELAVRDVFTAPTVALQAERVAALVGRDGGAAVAGAPPPLPPLPAAEQPVLAYAQERIWFLEQLAPGSAVYNIAGALRLLGPLRRGALARSLAEIVRRHEVLRSAYPAPMGKPLPEVLPPPAVPLPLLDLGALGAAGAAAASRLGAALGMVPFDLAAGPLLRALLLRLGPEEHVLALAIHHIVADGWSATILRRELAALYGAFARGEASPLAELPIQYFAFARWQRSWLTGERLEAELAWWRRQLAGAPAHLELPADRARPPAMSFRGARISALVPPRVAGGLRHAGQQSGATLFMTLLAALDVALRRWTGQEDLVVGSPIANRERLEIEGLIGCFVNTLALRADLSGRPSWGDALDRVRDVSLAAYMHQDLPFEKLVATLAPRRDLSTTPLFQVLLVVQSAAAFAQPSMAPLTVTPCDLEVSTAKFDLTLEAIEGPQGLVLAFDYSRDLFDAVTVKRLAAHFQVLLAGLAEGAGDPRLRLLPIAEAPLLGAAERQQLLEWNDTQGEPSGECRTATEVVRRPRLAAGADGLCLHELFAAQARRAPEALAVVADATGESLTYGALAARAGMLAGQLRDLGVGPEAVAAICVERGTDMVAGLLAILEAGGAFLPLDPDYPPDRLRYMLHDAGARVLVTTGELAARLGERLGVAGDGGAGVRTVLLDDPAGGRSGGGGRRPRRRRDRRDGRAAAASGRRGLPGGVQPANLAYVIYTSGSTGRPKGTMNTHRGIVNRVLWAQANEPLEAGDRVLQKTPLSFDVAVCELFWPLAAGARLVMARPGGQRDCEYLAQAIARRGITYVHFVPSMLRAFLESLDGEGRDTLQGLRRVLASGESLSYDLQRQFHATLAAPLHNLYGPTEAAVEVTHWQCDRDDPRPLVPIGRPVANTRIHVLDRQGQEVPIGVPGELHIGGVQLARGYLGRPDLTAERFVPDPFAGRYGEAGARLYRSGDLARFLPDGAIHCLGRCDHQVKVRGFRIELGEIEAVLAEHPAVAAAAVAVRSVGAAADPRLVAYVVPRAASARDGEPAARGPVPAADELRRKLAEKLPEHMVPAEYVFLDRLPLTPSGKLDRRALPEGPEGRAGLDGGKGEGAGAAAGAGRGMAPGTPVEALLAGLWAELLGSERVAVGDDFFALGGHSLLATQLAARIRQAFGVALPLRRVFELPTLEAMAREIGAKLAAGGHAAGGAGAPAAVAALDATAALAPMATGERLGAESLAAEDSLSYAQERIWFLAQLAPGSAAYNIPGGLRMRGRLDLAALRRSLDEIVRRHDVLRSSFPVVAGRPSPRVAANLDLRLPVVELAALGEAAAAASRLLAGELGRLPFDLASGPLVRAALLRLAPDEHLLVLALHHIVGDGWSVAVFRRELAALYPAFAAGEPSPLARLSIQYYDYARWQRGWLAGEALAAQLAYWRQALAGAPRHLALPADRPRPPVQSFRGARIQMPVPAGPAADLRRGARRSGATLFMILLAALDVLLARSTGQEDLVVGAPIANRERLEIEGLIGCFINVLALRADLSGGLRFGELLAQVRQVSLAAYAHQNLPFEKLVLELAPERDLSRPPLFQVLLVLQNLIVDQPGAPAAGGDPARRPPALSMELCENEATTAKFDLTLEVIESAQGLALSFEYSRDLFDAATIKRLAQQYRTLLSAVAAAGDRVVETLPLLSDGERHQLLVEWNDVPGVPSGECRTATEVVRRPRPGPAATRVEQLFEWQATRRPEAAAVAGQGSALSYGELEARANRLARTLRRLGVGPEVRVALCVERSPEMVAALLGILKAGGAYVPLDPSHPPARLALVLGDSSPAVLVTEERWLDLLGIRENGAAGAAAPGHRQVPAVVCLDRDADRRRIAAEAGSALRRRDAGGGPESLAYLLYTSGSTGRPKGVGLPHRAVVNFLCAMAERPGLGAGDVVPALTTLAFDIAGLEIYLPLAVGGRVEVVGSEEAADGRRLAARLAAAGVTTMQATPATWRLLLDAGWQGPGRDARPRSGPRRERSEGGGPTWLKGLCGGEALPRELASALAASGVELWNVYGPTETAVWSTARPAAGEAPPGAGGAGAVGLGAPIANTRLYVVDRSGEPVGVGVAGELLIGGDGVARGYWGRPELTAERFVPDRWSAAAGDRGPPAAGGRLYRTGDLVRRRADGDLEFLGRIDHQVKVRGFRIEVGEVEAALLRHPAVSQAVVVARGEAADRRLVAYLVPRAGEVASALAPAAVRELLRRWLPDYMVPAAFVVLAALPLTANGKLDRAALPAPAALPDAAAGLARPPGGPVEEMLAEVWAQVLGRERVGGGEDFFGLGGHSLLTTQLVSRVAETFGVELPLRAVFERPTLAAQAELIEASRREPRPAAPPLRREARNGSGLPLSFAQQRLWFLDQLEPGSPFYNMPAVLRFDGRLRAAVLARSLSEVVRRHETLRTSFTAVDGEPVQVIHSAATAAAERLLPQVDLAALPEALREPTARRLAREEARRPFDLGRAPMLRATLLRLAAEEHLLLLTLHHIACDGWSLGVLVEEAGLLYQAFAGGRPSPLPELAVQYADFAVWQRRWLAGEVLEAQLAYWRTQLAGLPPAIELPVDRPRPARRRYLGGRLDLRLPPVLGAALRALARQDLATPFMVLLSVFQALLARYSGQDDLAVGTPVANRRRTEVEGLIGFFANTLVLRGDLRREPSLAQLVARSREVALAAYSHQDLPFEGLVERLQPRRDLVRSPLFQVMLVLQNAPAQALRLPGLAVTGWASGSGTAKFDLTLTLADDEQGLPGFAGSFEYDAELFYRATVARLAGHFENLLAAAIAAPARPLSEVPLLSGAERRQLEEWNDKQGVPRQATGGAAADTAAAAVVPPGEQRGLAQLFAVQAERTPDAVAVVCDDEVLTYCGLRRRAERLARRLRALGIAPGVSVGLCCECVPDLIVGLYGIVMAGGRYVPLDPAYPEERWAWMLADSGAPVVVTQSRLRERMAAVAARAGEEGAAVEPAVVCVDRLAGRGAGAGPDGGWGAGPDDLVYVIYTSGSTGRAKGAGVYQRSFLKLVRWYMTEFKFTDADRFLLITSYGFDQAQKNLFASLLAGGTLHLAARDVYDPASLAAIIARQGITRLNCTPSAFLPLATGPDAAALVSLRSVFLGGEPIPVALLDPWRRSRWCRAEVVNTYGPTECTDTVTWHRLAAPPAHSPPALAPAPAPPPGARQAELAAPPPPIGRPLPDVAVWIADRRLGLVPIGVPGQLCLGGDFVGAGYLGNAAPTAAVFVPDPWSGRPGERMYLTGDLARLLPDGEVEFLGRIDQQVKIRGFRVETGEVESVLARHPQVRDAAVVARPAGAGAGAALQLVAYVVRRERPAAAGAPAAAQAAEQQVAAWNALYEETYEETEEDDPTLNLAGWNSSYTGLPIPPEEMREWVETTVERLLALAPRRVLEVGCGTGLLLFRIAPHCESYRGTDFSRAALAGVARQLARWPGTPPPVSLARAAADDWRGVTPGEIDLVILNSVAQYFPTVEYLVRVIEQAVAAVTPGGKIFLGDVRSLDLAPAFYASVELAAAPAELPAVELRRRVRRRQADEEELLVSPELFRELARRLPAISRVAVWKKRGRAKNELTSFRYDVVLTAGAGGRAPGRQHGAAGSPAAALDWRGGGLTLAALEERLSAARGWRGRDGLVVTGIPDGRLAATAAAVELLAEPAAAAATAGQLRQAVAERALRDPGVDPEEICRLGARLGLAVELLAAGPGTAGGWRFTAVLRPARRVDAELAAGADVPAAAADVTAAAGADMPAAAAEMNWTAPAAGPPLAVHGNDPLRARLDRELVPELRRWAKAELPDYMVPSAFVVLDGLPLTAHGKLDRAALPAPEPGRQALSGAYTAPRTPIEESLAQIWADLLGIDRVGAGDNFFDLGGHSLLATQVVSRLRQRFAVELPVRALFEEPTVAGLAGRVETALRPAAAGGSADLGPPLARMRRPAGAAWPAGETVAGAAGLPLSFAQQRLWFLDRLTPGSPAYNMPLAVRLAGELDAAALAGAVDAVVGRHETLRTTFHEVDGEPRQEIAPPAPAGRALPLVDLRRLPPCPGALAAALDLAGTAARRPFDLARGPLFRPALLRLADREHVWLGTMHHIVADGWSMGILVRELTAVYAALVSGREPRLPALPVQYADYAAWQRRWLTGEVLAAKIAYWRERLAGLPARLELPADRPRPAVETTAGAKLQLRLPAATAGRLRRFAGVSGATPFMVLLSAFGALLGRWAGQQDLAVGTPIAGRDRVEIEGLIGCFVNSLALRADLGGNPSFAELVGRTRETALAAFAHQELPFERLVEELGLARHLAHPPLFQVMFVLQNTPDSPAPQVPGLPGLTLEPLAVASGTAKYELTLSLGEAANGLEGWLEYRTGLFDGATAARLLRHFARLLDAAIAAPKTLLQELPLLTAGERHQLLVEWSGGEVGASGVLPAATAAPAGLCLHRWFEAAVERAPEAVAAVYEGGQLTYGELNRRANRLARHLRRLGVGPEVPVALCLDRSLELVAGILGIAKAGGAYVPLDPAYPRERLAFIAADALAGVERAVLVTRQRFAGLFEPAPSPAQMPLHRVLVDADRDEIGCESGENLDGGGPPLGLAYVIYTSGSTGKPKGVLVTHANVVRLFTATRSWFGFGARDVWTLFHSAAFDFSVWELWGALLHGGRLVIVPYWVSRSPESFHRLLAEQGVTVLNQTPSAFRQLIDADAGTGAAAAPACGPGATLALRLVIFGGEPVDLASLAPWMKRHGDRMPRLVNMYGITETTVHVTYRRLVREDVGGPQRSPIGSGIPDLRLSVLDAWARPVPLGVAGEIHVGGAGVARGYLRQPELTATRFLPEAGGGRLYRTGDLARWRADGGLEFLGRVDDQVKIRGFRIEPGEIEAALAGHPAVRQAAVAAVDAAAPGERRLIAWVAASGELAAAELRAFLAARLPDFMIPGAIAIRDALPVTANGKIDRRQLVRLGAGPEAAPAGAVRPAAQARNVVEAALAAIWSELLGRGDVGRDDSFFDLGGHSLLAVRLMSRIRERFGRELPLATLFRAGTIARMAALLQAGSGSAARAALVELTPAAPSSPARPLFCVHPAGGNVVCYAELARALGSEQPFYGLQLPDPEVLGAAPTIEAMAAHYVAAVAAVAPAGPLALAGWSLGGVIAYEMARQLQTGGREVGFLALIDPSPLSRQEGGVGREGGAGEVAGVGEALLRRQFAQDLLALASPGGNGAAAAADQLQGLDLGLPLPQLAAAAQVAGLLPPELSPDDTARLFGAFRATRSALDRYRPVGYPGRLTLLLAAHRRAASSNGHGRADPATAWAAMAGGGAEIEALPGDHYSIVRPPAVEALARRLARRLAVLAPKACPPGASRGSGSCSEG